MDYIEFFLLGSLVAASAHMTWFHSSFPVHVFQLLQRAGWRRHDLAFWPEESKTKTWLRHEWELWASLRLPPLLAELLTCPVCLSWHISLWTAVILTLALQVPWYFIGLCLAWPRVILYLDK